MTDRLTHINARGEASMVDVSGKDETRRCAVAEGRICMNDAAFTALSQNRLQKGDALATARIAGVMAAKKTSDLIPLCHPLSLEQVAVTFEMESHNTIRVTCETVTSGKTGVEMEALSAVSVSLLTIYDMAKALDRTMKIFDIQLVSKAGGKSGDYARQT